MSNAEEDYYAEIVELRAELEMAEATIRESRDAQRRLGNSVATLRAELERVRGERDHIEEQFNAWREGMEAAAEKTCQERDGYIERCKDLQTVQLQMVEELAKVEGEARVAREERDAARAAAGAWKRREAKAKEILELLVDPNPCHYDHHGYCQEHWAVDSNGQCVNKSIRQWLAAQDD